MDTSMAGLLSGLARTVEVNLGPEVISKGVAEEFADNGPNNPLNKLEARDKAQLLAIMVVYEHFRDASDEKITESAERVARLAADAGKLARRIEIELSEGSFLGIWEKLLDHCRDLQSKLSWFSIGVGELMDSTGKKGHKQNNLSNCFLVTASEFVRLKTGTYNDEHFAELFQGRSDIPESKELSGDAIRKKREYLQKKYPNLYGAAVEAANDMCR